MIYCINSDCNHRQNPENRESCQTCGTPLLVRDKYWLLRPICPLDPERSTEIFEVAVEGEHRVMKILKRSSPKLVELFDQEAFILEILDHPGIPKLDLDGHFHLHLETGKTLHCLVMEKIEGQNLEQWLEENGKISQKVARNWLEQLLKLVDYIHAQGFFHRDIKPSNIMLKPDGQLAIIDFGTVREVNESYMIAFRSGHQPNVTSIVSRGYTAPEQMNGRAIPESDLFALGRTFVHLLTATPPGELPVEASTGRVVWQKKAPQVYKLFADLIDDLMAPLPRNRPKDSEVVLRSLDNLRLRSIERFITSPRFKVVAIASVSFGILFGIASFFVNKQVIAPLQAEARSQAGREALMSGDLDIARKNFEEAIALNPQESIFYNDLGLVCNLQQEYKCALEKYQRSLEMASDRETADISHYNLGDLYQKTQNFDAALAEYEISMRSYNAISVSAKNNYARLQIWQYQNYNESIDLLKSCLTEIDNFDLSAKNATTIKTTTYKNLGWAYLQKADYPTAENYLRSAIALDRDNRAAHHCLLAKTLQAQKEVKNALIAWQNCHEKDANDLPEVKTWQGDAYQYLNAQEKNQ